MDPVSARTLRATALALAAWAALLPRGAHANVSVRGTVSLPPVRAERPATFWPRVENGVLPIAPPLVSPMSEVVVVLEGPTTVASWSGSIAMEILGADFVPRVLPVLVGTLVEFKNADRSPYNVFSPENGSFFSREEVAPGRSRKIKFLAPGTYAVRTDEFPHMEGTVLVLQTNLYARPDERGGFKIESVPEGRYSLKVFYKSGFVHQQTIDVGKSPLEVRVTVPSRAARRSE